MVVHVFVGPTLAASTVRRLAPDAMIHHPVRHGDLLRLPLELGDTVVVIDGYYHHAAPVRHKEILQLLATGVSVVGCASMGALRAAELERYGMVGSGVVFGMYRDGVIDGDDEVAVAHSEGPEYRRFSLPLVNLRHAARVAEAADVLSPGEHANVLTAARAFPYTTRTWRAIGSVAPGEVAKLRAFLVERPEHADRKAADAEEVLSRLASFSPSDEQKLEWSNSPRWRNKFITEWVADFKGAEAEGFFVSDGAVARYRQIYDPDTPQRRRQHVLEKISGIVGATPRQAIESAARHGVTVESLSDTQLVNWLTLRESEVLPPEEVLVTVLVRAHRPPHPTDELVAMLTEGRRTFSSDERLPVAECLAVNAEVSGWAPGQEVGQLRFSTLRDHLGEVWQASGYDELQAAARDRGFPTVGKAVAAVRPFYLRSHFKALGRRNDS